MMLMSKLLSGPAVEPVTLDEALVQCHANAGIEDEWFKARIVAGREKVEEYIRRSLITQSRVLRHDGAIGSIIDLPRSPVQTVTSICIDGQDINIDSAVINIDIMPARVILPHSANSSLRIEYIAGYGDNPEDVPAPLRDAILLYVSHNYGNREGEKELTQAFFNLIEPYRMY